MKKSKCSECFFKIKSATTSTLFVEWFLYEIGVFRLCLCIFIIFLHEMNNNDGKTLCLFLSKQNAHHPKKSALGKMRVCVKNSSHLHFNSKRIYRMNPF